jgi:hypothetical protein
MPPQFIHYTAEQVRATLEPAGFNVVKLPKCGELVLERNVERHPDVLIRVYSSISINNGGARDVGTDAGRVLLIERKTGKPIWKSKRAHRTQNFLEALLERCRIAWKSISSIPRCPVCAGYMVERSKRGERRPSFLGCLKFPACRGRRDLSRRRR